MAQHTFLVEIGTAELPPKALRSLAEAFADNLKSELTKADLAFGDVEWFASPRRLALKVHELAGEQPSKSVEKRGPAVAQAFDADGKPTKVKGLKNLKDTLQPLKGDDDKMAVLVSGDKETQYKNVIEVLDEVKKMHFERVGLETSSK